MDGTQQPMFSVTKAEIQSLSIMLGCLREKFQKTRGDLNVI